MIFSEIDQTFMRMAMREAAKAFEADECPIGAVVTLDNRVIGKGYNQTILLNDPTAHAEMIAITAAANSIGKDRLKECSLYVTLEPCLMCSGAIIQSRIDTLFFSAFEPKTGACGSLYNVVQDDRLNHTVKVFSGLYEQESRLLLQEFFLSKRNKNIIN